MSTPDKQARSHVWRRFLDAVQGPLHSIYATGKSWRVSSVRTALPDHQLADKTEIQNKAMAVPKRQREKSSTSVSSQRAVSQHPELDDGTPREILPQLTPDIVWNIRRIAKQRKKLELLNRKSQKWQSLYNKRKENVLQLEEELTHMAKPTDADTASVRSIKSRLEKSRDAYEESDQKMTSLRRSLWTYESNITFALAELENPLRKLLSDRGLLQDHPSEPDTSDNGSTRSTKRAQTIAESVEAPPSPDPEAVKKREAIALLRKTRARCHEIEADFENRSELYKDRLERWKEHVAAGELDVSRTEFDITWCFDYGNLGLDLLEAEMARSQAADAVMKLNALPTAYSQTSKFPNDPEDEAGLEHEAERAMATLDVGKVEDWLRSLDETPSPVDQSVEVEADDWDVQSLQFGEGCSGIADNWVKIRVKHWDMVRAYLWNETKSNLHGDFALPSDTSTTQVDPTVVETANLIYS